MIERPTKQLLSDGDSNTKLRKNEGQGYITAGLSLSPSTEAGIGNTCPHASEGCKAACLDHQGMASVFKKIRESRMNKTRHYYNEREDFFTWLRAEIKRYIRKAIRKDSKLAIRLNVFSDIPWEASGIIDEFPEVQFYDYTKNPRRAGQLRENYWVTFSRSESNEEECLEVLRNGGNVTVVFADIGGPSFVGNQSGKQLLPDEWHGFEVIDGDTTDLRFDDPKGGRVIGLRLKAHSKDERLQAIRSGFAVTH